MGTTPAGNGSTADRTTYSQLENGEAVKQRIRGLDLRTADRVDAYLSGDQCPAVRWTDVRTVVKKSDLVVATQGGDTTRYLRPDDCGWSEYQYKPVTSSITPRTLRERRKVYPDRAVIPLSESEAKGELKTVIQSGTLGFELAEVAMPEFKSTPEYLKTRAVIGVDQYDDVHVWDSTQDAMYVLGYEGRYSWVANAVEPDPLLGEADEDTNTISDWVEFIEEEWGWKIDTVGREAHRDVIRGVREGRA